jgi:pimeloyl-ACP methyl ester carboxylesterase
MKSTAILGPVLGLLLLLPAGLLAQSAEETVSVRGGSLSYRSMGSGPPVVLLHGYSTASSVWAPYLTELAAQHRVLAFDLPGHGRSDSLRSTFTHRGAAESLLEALDSLGISTVDVVGHSSGGLIALHMALLRPERILSIVTIATPWRGVPASVGETAGQVSVETAPPPMLEALRAWHPGGTEQIRWLFQQQRRMAADSSELALGDEQILRIQTRALVVHGDRDPLLPVGDAVDLAARLPEASLLVLPGGGHEVIMEPGLPSRLLTAALSAFLGDPPPN